jgi:Domain of unknown function (DUF6438)
LTQKKPPQLGSLTTDELKTVVISFERTGCYGNCPAYKLTIRGDGHVDYKGIRDVMTTGNKSGSIDDTGLRSILAAFSKANFFSIGDDVSEQKCSCRVCTDFPTVLTTIDVAGNMHSVSNYHGCGCSSDELWNLEKTIDKVVNVEQWTGDVSKAGPNGTTCWDPKPRKN